ncbi:MAG: helix-hairpin-helix domain-containing protein, partial [Clostridiales Family XIII bacterium]|nr:helix-hairpin-helix domain-containing protein [Clostridiales Family XIII bacterium]
MKWKILLSDPKGRKVLVAVLVVLLLVAIGAARYAALEGGGGDVVETGGVSAAVAQDAGADADVPAVSAAVAETPQDEPADAAEPLFVFVDVGGAVASPGVIAMPAGSRIVDAIAAAGGLSDDADVSGLNQAVVLADSDKIYVPTADEVLSGNVPTSAGQGGRQDAAPTAGTVGGSAAAAASGIVNINTADSDGLQQLSGVGPATAQKIIDYRNTYGAFLKPEDLMNVSGIGEKTFAKLKA